MRRRHELTDAEWGIIQPLLPNKPRGVPRVDEPLAAGDASIAGSGGF